MTDLSVIWGAVHEALASPEASHYAHKGLEWLGVLAWAPRLLTAALPLATKAAHRVSALLLATPGVREVVLILAPDIVKFLNEFTAALEKILNTFSDALEEDITKAAAAEAPKAGQPGPAGPQ